MHAGAEGGQSRLDRDRVSEAMSDRTLRRPGDEREEALLSRGSVGDDQHLVGSVAVDVEHGPMDPVRRER
jgi:hypothetical protein